MTGQAPGYGQGALFGQLTIDGDGAAMISAAPPARPGPADVHGSVCIAGSCLAHRRGTYWNLQDAAWVHTDGWPCDALADVPDPGCVLAACCGRRIAVGHIPACCPGCGRVMVADNDGQVVSLPPPAPVAPQVPMAPKWAQRIITCALCGYSTGKRHLMRPYAGSEAAVCCTNDGACKRRQEHPEAFRHTLRGGAR